MRRLAFVVLVVALFSSAAEGPSASASGSRNAPLVGPRADYNGDGFADLAVGIPSETVSGKSLAGAVNVIYGTARGLSASGTQLWHQDRSGIRNSVNEGDYFGYSLAPADFNGDGFSDLAIGVRDENVGDRILAGAINVLYGSSSGLTAAGNQFWHRDSPGVLGRAGIAEEFSYSMTAGDFNGDGYADLVAGTPWSHPGGAVYAGDANVFYGSASGLTSAGSQRWTQNSSGVQDMIEEGDGFASSLVAGDFDGDGLSDLAVGVGHESLGPIEHAGAVNLLYGSRSGLSAARDQLWHQDRPGVLGQAQHEDAFGWFGMAAGDFNGDAVADLAVGLPDETVGGDSYAGSMNVLYGSGSGLTAAGNQVWNQDSSGVGSESSVGDRFAYDLAAGDFDRDRYADVAIGALGESVTYNSEGAVNVLYGGASGLSASRDQFWSQNSPGIVDEPEDGDYFGHTLAVGNWGNGPQADLAIAAPYETIVGDDGYEGAVHVLYGSLAGGLSSTGSQFWHQGVSGIPDDLEGNDFYGFELS
jgi:disulfide bond formation protein DsbB